jgi:Fe-S cluster biogenesis protein NfuA
MFRSIVTRSRAIASLTRLVAAKSTTTTTAPARSLHHLAAAAATSGPTSSTNFPRPQAPHNSIQYRTVFIQTENTPNPESVKFVPGIAVLDNEDGNGYFVNKTDPMEDILKSPLCTQLFKVDGIKAVYLGANFVTITKYAEHKWQLMRPEIFSVLMDFFDSNQAVLLDQPLITDTTILEDDDEIVAMIKELIEARIRPAVQEDGGDIRYVSFDEEDGLVTVQLAGSCVGCPSSSVTLKQGVENMLMHYIPEVTAVVALEEEPEEGEVSSLYATEEEEEEEPPSKQKTYEERLAAAGIPFSE